MLIRNLRKKPKEVGIFGAALLISALCSKLGGSCVSVPVLNTFIFTFILLCWQKKRECSTQSEPQEFLN